MKSKLRIFYIIGFVIMSALGTALHFLNDFTSNKFTQIISPVNESVWEHLKLIFFPLVVFAIIQALFWRKDFPFAPVATLTGMFVGLILKPSPYYIYTAILGTKYMVIDIAIYYISMLVAFILSYDLTQSKEYSISTRWTVYIFTIIIALLFVYFTTNPPNIVIFNPPS